MNKYHLLGLIFSSIVLSACLNQSAQQSTPLATESTPSSSKPQQTNSSKSANQPTTYTLAEVAQHNQTNDCWLAIEGKVYNVTPFISSGKHPGGEAILQGCGKDATTLFNTRPMGSGTPHSDTARSNLSNFYIGQLAK